MLVVTIEQKSWDALRRRRGLQLLPSCLESGDDRLGISNSLRLPRERDLIGRPRRAECYWWARTPAWLLDPCEDRGVPACVPRDA